MYLCQKLLDQTIVGLTLVILNDNEEIFVLDDTMIFTLKDGQKFQLFLDVDNQIFLFELSEVPDTIHLPFLLESNEDIITKPLITRELNVTLPFTIASITEIYVSYDDDQKVLLAIVLWSSSYNTSLSICVETDEIELLTRDKLVERLIEISSLEVSLHYCWYDTYRYTG